jgi:ferredoxin
MQTITLMSDAPALLTARTEPDQLQVDAWSNEPLLVSLEMGGSHWPSSCRNGNCRTCLGRLHSGTVRYAAESQGLSAEEHAQGYVLPCVAYPCTDVVVQLGY